VKTDSCAPLASVIDLLLDAICVVDAQGHLVYVSAACERIFGYKPEEMVGKQMIEMVYPEDRARTMAAAGEVMADQPLLHFENRYVRKDGSVAHIMWSACWSADSKLRIGVARDITQRKQSEAMQAALYSISEAAHGAKDLAALYQQIHLTIAQLLPVDDFIVAIRNAASGELTYPYQALALDSTSLPTEPAASLCFSVLHGAQPLRFNADSMPALALPFSDGDTHAWWLGVPLNSSEGVIGVLMLKSTAAPYTEKDQELLHSGGNGNRAQAAVCAPAPDGAVRRTHRPAEPRLFSRSPGHGAGAGSAQWWTCRIALRGSGSLQAGQRYLRPQRWRPAAARSG